MIFDTHAHYDDEAFDEDRDELLKSMQPGGNRMHCECRRQSSRCAGDL